MRGRRLVTVAAVVTGAATGVGIGLPLAEGDSSVLVLSILTAIVVGALLSTMPRDGRRGLVVLVALALGLRLAAAAVLYYGSLATGRGGFITGDDASYASISWGYLQWLRGEPVQPYVPPLWHGNGYLFGTFVYLESALFAVFGPTPLAMTTLNALFSGIFIVLLYDMARRLWDGRVASFTAAAVALYPSLVLWSALNLKDALALALVGSALWLVVRLQRQPHPLVLAASALPLLLLESLRRYLFVGLLVLVPVGIALGGGPTRRRAAWALSAVALSAILFDVVSVTGGLSTSTAALAAGGVAGLERTRAAMAAGANTAFAGAAPVRVQEGDTYVILAAPGTPVSGSAPRTVVVPPGTLLVLAGSSGASHAAGATVVGPGDIVVVSSRGTAAPPPAPSPEALTLGHVGVLTVEQGDDNETLALTRTVSYLPRGLAYTLFAPFPWDARGPRDLATIPEMLLWYVSLVALPFAVWQGRRQPAILLLALYVAGLLGLFVLVEGNVGTLFRHRAMVIPFVLMLASPAMVEAASRLQRRQ